MSGSDDSFGEDIAALENVQQLESTDYLCEYTGVLADTNQRIRIITLAPELADVDAAVDAFTEVSDQWYNASANANIRPVRERGTDPRPWVALPDDNAQTLVTVQPDLSPDAIETVISEIADALRTLGLYNTVHGHLSPDDIYVTNVDDEPEQLTVEVGGFGLEADVRAAINEAEPTAYTAPELLDGANQSSEQTDVYGLGAVTYFALTGQAPVAGSDLSKAISDGPTNPPSTYTEGMPADVDEVVMQALSVSPGDRYESPYAFHRAFLSVFDVDAFQTSGDADESASETAESTNAADGDEDESTPEESAQQAINDDEDKDETDSITRRAVVGVLGLSTIGGGIWYGLRNLGRSDNQNPNQNQREPIWRNSVSGFSVPAVVDGTVYVGSENNNVYALSTEDGTEQWSYQTGGSVDMSPAVVDGTVYVGSTDNNVYALSADDGTEQWRFQTDDEVRMSPTVVDGTAYIGNEEGGLYALAADDGTEQWQFQANGISRASPTWTSPAFVEGTIYVGNSNGGGSVYALSADSGTQQWEAPLGSWVLSAPTVVNETVYVGDGDGSVYALSTEGGNQRWQFQTSSEVVNVSPAVTEETVYVATDSIYALSAEDGTEQWSKNITGVGLAVVDGTVYIGNNSELNVLSADDGTEQWVYDGIWGALVPVNGTIYASGFGGIKAIPADSPTMDSWPMYQSDKRNTGSDVFVESMQ